MLKTNPRLTARGCVLVLGGALLLPHAAAQTSFQHRAAEDKAGHLLVAPEQTATGSFSSKASEAQTSVPVHPGSLNDADAEESWYVDPELIHVLEREASRKLSAFLQRRGELRVVDVKITISMSTKRILADIGEGYRPGPDADEMFLQELIVTLRHYAEAVGLRIDGVDLNFQGKPLEYYYPEELRVPAPVRTNPNNRSALVSPGHGLVRVHPRLYWDWQLGSVEVSRHGATRRALPRAGVRHQASAPLASR